jgi:glycosyltransferase involved in cell wall biosynthesis
LRGHGAAGSTTATLADAADSRRAVTTASIVVTSHDHEPFLRHAIESALQQTRAGVEVVVVDDGSRDGSPRVIEGYGRAVRAVFQEHRGQAWAMAAGLHASAGDVVLFLDSDDILYPDALARLTACFRPSVAKAQGRLDLMDAAGRRLGRQTPPMALPSGDLVPMVLEHGWYPAPPTSGNAFARATLETLLPVPGDYSRIATAEGRRSVSDHYLSILGALTGEVVSVTEPVGAYRVRAHQRPRDVAAHLADVRRIIERADALVSMLRRWAEARGRVLSPALDLGTPNRAKMRLVSLLLDPAGHPVPGDTRWRLLAAGLAATWTVPWSSTRLRATQSVGLLALATLPRAALVPVLSLALLDHERPRWLSRLAGMEA